MKKILKSMVVWFLKILVKVALWRFSPRIIAIAGTEGKSDIRDAITEKLLHSGHIRIRENSRGLNTEIGLPLAILDEPTGKSDIFAWMTILASAFRKAVLEKHFPQVLVLELGVDQPGEMKKLLRIIQPDISVVYCIRPRGFGDEQFLRYMEQEFRLLMSKSYRFIANKNDERIVKQAKAFSPPGTIIPLKTPVDIAEDVEVMLSEIMGAIKKVSGKFS